MIVNTNSIGPAHLTTAVAGNGLSGGNGTALAVNVDGTTLTISADTLSIPDGAITLVKLAANSITKAKIDATAIVKATTGSLSFDTTNGLSVNTDGTTIEVNGSNALQVKASSITSAKVDATVYVRGTSTLTSPTSGKIHISTAAPTGTDGASGDIWLQYA